MQLLARRSGAQESANENDQRILKLAGMECLVLLADKPLPLRR